MIMTQLSRKLFFVTSIVICVMTYITIGIWFNYDMSIVNLTNIIGHSIFTTQSILDELHSCKKCPSNINKVSMINPLFLHPNEPFLQQHSANPICKYLFPAYSFHSVTHKNGVFMFSQFITSMRRYCNIINVNATTMKSYKYHAGFMQTLGMIWGNIFQLFYFIDSSKQLHKRNQSNHKILFLFQIREPLDVFWSAYQYHKSCETGSDPWIASFTKSYRCIHNRKNKLVIQWDDIRFNGQPPLAHNKSINTEHAMRHRYSLCQYYNDNSISIDDMNKLAIFYEFIRYINCQSPVNGWYWLHTLYKRFKLIQRETKVDVFQMSYFSMSQWLNDFDLTAYRFIDAFNVVDNEENRNILKAHSASHINITHERHKLFRLFSSQNANKWSSRHIKNYNVRHKHLFMFDSGYNSSKSNAIEWLLKHDQICHIIRNITLSFDFNWRYNHVC
eukprot:396269_1